MLFSEIYSPSSLRPQMSEEQMRQAKINRWGTDAVGSRDVFSEDYSGKFNTELSTEDEAKYQAWAKENHREKDVYDYDLRGAWKELQSGTMSEDERDHLGDKYKKPNHPTFSDQSIYSGQDGVTGGVWSRNAEGKDVYTPGRKLSSVEADRLRRYFARNEPGVVLDLKDKVFEERPLPGVNTPLGIFSGLGDTWKGIPAALLQTTSSAITAFKNTGADILSRMGTDETRAWWEGQKAVMDQNARDIREYNKVHFEVDPETMGTASQIVHGLFKTLPKALGYGLVGGVAGGALAFGADVGIDETNRLMDEGVDRNTAINAGLVSFAMNAIGMRLPAVLGASRGMSAAYGAAANAGTNVAEVEGIKFILEHQDYNQLAQQYDLNAVDLAVSATMGAAFGGAFWRSPEQIRTQKYQNAARLVFEDQRAALFNKGKSQFDFKQAGMQAAINSRAVVSLAKRLGIEPDKVRDFAAKIVWSEDGKSAAVPEGELSQIIGINGVQAMNDADKDWTRTNNWYTALEMEGAGKTPEEIHAATGWERGADGEWRYEIPDVQFKKGAFTFLHERAEAINREANEAFDEAVSRTNSLDEGDTAEALVRQSHEYDVIEKKLSDLVDAPELFKAYPELKDMVVEFGQLPKNVRGYFAPGDNVIRLSYSSVIPADGNVDTQSVLAHEIQHAIQSIEGFVGGANPEIMPGKGRALFRDMSKLRKLYSSPVWQEYQEVTSAMWRLVDPDPEVKEARIKSGLTEEEIQAEWENVGKKQGELGRRPEVQAVRDEQKRLTEKYGYDRDIQYAINHDLDLDDPVFKRIDDAYPNFKKEGYKRVAGEVEARNVQRRLPVLNAEQRKNTPLRMTEDVPRAEQITASGDSLGNEFYQVAYHGSPYLFDKFTLDHIGEGEGAQAHGWGLYFALDRATAEGYRNKLAAVEPEKAEAEYKVALQQKKAAESYIREIESARSEDLRQMQKDGASADEIAAYEKDFAGEKAKADSDLARANARLKDSERARSRLYQVEIPDEDVMLREDADFESQPEKVREALASMFPREDDQGGTPLRERAPWLSQKRRTREAIVRELQGLTFRKPAKEDNLSLQNILDFFGGDVGVAETVEYHLTPEEINARLAEETKNNEPAIRAIERLVRESIEDGVDGAWFSAFKERHPFIKSAAEFRFAGAEGGRIYHELAEELGGPKEASLALNRAGIKGIRYRGDWDGECAVVWDEKAIEMREFLQKALQDGEIRGSFNPQTNTIKLTPNANLSTFSHEHSHWYLTNLFAHAADENLSPEARADIDALLKAFGLKSVEEYNALPFEQKVKLQEQYAAWTERYLSEGKVPAGYLQGMFRNFARWLMDMYRDLIGEGAGDDAAKKEIGERYKAQFGEELPELSADVRRVLNRMYDAEKKMASFRSNSGQVAAARVIQAQRTNNQKVTAPLQDGAAPNAYTAAIRAQQQAAQAMNSGEQVDVSQTMKNVPANDAAVRQAQNAFAKSFQMGDTGTIVVLQNRDRTGAVSVGQMNAIATAPDYTRLSVSRTTDSGAPIVSFGTLPDSQYLGNTETVADGSHKIPMTYAVVEADSVLRSNNFDGTPVPEYGTDPSRMHAIAGNGRMAGLSEAYNRGTAEQYRQDLMADAESVGINPEVVAGMQHPVLVRYMTPEEVTTGFIERSNSSNVLEKSALETAVQDSPRIRNNVWKYQFDEDGAPTPETVRQFTIDIGEPNSLGKLLTADGRPTETATNRLRAAVFYEAYRDRTLTALVADDTDKQGIKRILNAMAAFAPHVINIREASNGAVDLGPILVDVVNRIRNAKIEGTPLESIIGQGDVFGDNPAVQQLLGFIAENQNSAAAIARVFEPFAAAVGNRLKSSGNGPQGGLFGEAENVATDLADVMGIFRDTQNRLIDEGNAAMREKGATEGFREALPAVDVMAMRNTLQAMQQAEKPAENVVKSVVETVSEDAGVSSELPPDIPPDAGLDAEAKAAAELEARQAHELEGLSEENSERVQVEDLAALNPDFIYKFKDENGIEHQMTAAEILADEASIDKQADTDMAGLATAAMCIIRNNGIPA